MEKRFRLLLSHDNVSSPKVRPFESWNFFQILNGKSKFTETQIVKAIQEHEAGRKAEDICREMGITTASFYKWRQRDGAWRPVR